MAFLSTGLKSAMRFATLPTMARSATQRSARVATATAAAPVAALTPRLMPRQRLVRTGAKLSTATAELTAETLSYPGGVKLMHWIGGLGTLCCFATVQAAQRKWAPASEMMMCAT